MKHHTNNAVDRASHVADREAEAVWQETGDYTEWEETWKRVYYEALRELAGCSSF